MSGLGADLQALLSKCNPKVIVLNIMLEALNGFLIRSGLGGDWKGDKLKYEADVVLQMIWLTLIYMAVLDSPLSGHPVMDGSATHDDGSLRIYKPVDVHMMWGCRITKDPLQKTSYLGNIRCTRSLRFSLKSDGNNRVWGKTLRIIVAY
jgi:hypothetical protein